MAAAPFCLLLFLFLTFLLSCDSGPTGTPLPEKLPLVLSKQNLKNVITLLERQIKVLHQRQLILKHALLKKQNKSKTAHIKGSFVKENATPTSLTLQEITFSNGYSKLFGTKFYQISPPTLMAATVKHNKVKNAGIKEDTKERPLLFDLKQDKYADNNDRPVRTTSITLPAAFYSAYSSSKTQIENYSLKNSKGISEVSAVTSQYLKMHSVKSKDNAMQMVINSSMSKKLKHFLERGRRKLLLKPSHGLTGKSAIILQQYHPTTEPLKVVSMGKPTHQPPLFEKSNPTVTSDPKDRSQSILRQQAELSLKVLEKILCYLKRKNEMQSSLSPYEKIQASIMATLLQEFNEQEGQEFLLTIGKTDSSKHKIKITLKPFRRESSTVLVSNEHSLNATQATTVPNITTDATNKSLKHANRLKEDGGAEDEKKVAEVKDMLKDISIACIAVTALILATIAFLLICISLFLKKTQEAITTNQNKETQSQGDYTENQNNNNLMFVDKENTDSEFVSENEDTAEHLKTQPVENMSCNSSSREPDIFLSAEHLQELHYYNSPSCNHIHENLSEHSRTFKINPTSCNHPEHFEKPEDHEDKRLQEKYTYPYRKDSDHQRPSSHQSKFTEARCICPTCSDNHCCYCSSSRLTHFSSNASVTLGVNESINDSRLFQHDGSQCACFKFQKGSTDSYSD